MGYDLLKECGKDFEKDVIKYCWYYLNVIVID